MSDQFADLSFEDAMQRLERIVADLEAGNFSLAESLVKFEEGIALGKHCRELLGRADLRIRTLLEGTDGTLSEGDALDGE